MIINLIENRRIFSNFLKGDKVSGVKKAWYFYNIEANQIQAIDTYLDFKSLVNVYKIQNIDFYKTIIVDKSICNKLGVKYIKLHIYRNDNLNLQGVDENDHLVFDRVAYGCGYMPADSETGIAEVIL